MDTSKVSLPPIRQMLYNLTADQVEQKESTHVPPSLACSHSPDYEDKQLNYRHASLPMKHNNNEAVYTFDSWHECLPTPPYSSPESDAIASCQCAPKGLVHASCFPPPAISPSSAKKYAHHHRQQQHDRHDYTPPHYHYPPSSHRHRRAHSASTSTSPFIRTPTPTVIPLSPPSYHHGQPFVPYHQHFQHQSHYSHQVKQSVEWRSSINGGGALYRGRTRAHTTSGYLPSSAMVPPSSPVSSSSSSSSSTTSLSPTNSSAPFMQKPSSPPYNIPITSHHHHLVESTHVSRVPLASTLRQQQQQQRHRYHCPHCRKTFSRPSSLRIHIYSHTGEKPHVCPYFNCGRRFSVQSNMRRHIRVHVGNNDTTPLYPRYYPEGSLQPPHLMTIPSL